MGFSGPPYSTHIVTRDLISGYLPRIFQVSERKAIAMASPRNIVPTKSASRTASASESGRKAGPRLIVPVVTPGGISQRLSRQAAARLTYHGGHLLTNVEVVTIFWGAAWANDTQLINELNQFFDYI